MPPFDPRHWNLLPASMLAAVACNPGKPGATTSSDDTSSTGDADTEYTEYTEYSETNYSEEGYAFECYSQSECPEEEVCISLYCRSYFIPDECELPSLVEIPLPELPNSDSVALADVDGDGDDELLILRNDGVTALLDDDSVITTTWPMPLGSPEGMVALALDEDAAVDLLVYSLSGDALVALGDGAGGFEVFGSITGLPQLASPLAIDVDLDGLDEMVALDRNMFEALIYEDLLGLSNVGVMLDDTGIDAPSGLGILQADADAPPDVLIDSVCQARLLYGPDLSTSDFLSDPKAPHGQCKWGGVAFAEGEPEQPFALMMGPTDQNQETDWLQRFHMPEASYQYLALPENYASFAAVGPTSSASGSLLLNALGGMAPGAMIWDWADDGSACYSLLPFSGRVLAIGHLDAGTRNFVISGDSELRMWSLDP